jgi:hypothetical protein
MQKKTQHGIVFFGKVCQPEETCYVINQYKVGHVAAASTYLFICRVFSAG